MTLSVQFMTMITMIISGVYLGAIRDTFNRFSKLWKNNVFLLYSMEISFWLLQTFILFYVLFLVNAGALRVYIFIACLLGFAMYQALFAKLYKRILEWIIRAIKSVYRFFVNVVKMIIIQPIKFIIHIIIVSVLAIINLIISILMFCLKLLYMPVFWVLKGIYRLLPGNIQNILHKLAGIYSNIKNICIRCKNYITSKRR